MLFIILAIVLGFLLTWSDGANDLANIMSTTIFSRAISMKYVVIIAVFFEFAGAFLGGSGVSHTLRNGIINTQLFINQPYVMLYGMTAVLFATTAWMTLASYLGLPVSVTNAMVGSIVGFGAIVLGSHAIHWQNVGFIAISWVASPAIAGIIANLLFIMIQRSILVKSDPYVQAKKYMPFYLFFVGIILAVMIVIKGLDHFKIDVHHHFYIPIVALTAFLVLAVFIIPMRKIKPESKYPTLHEQFAVTERMFSILMCLTACAMVFAHGSNDVAIAVGPMASIITIAQSGGKALLEPTLPGWIVFLGCVGIIAGFFTYGRKVMETVGKGITTLTPSRAFSATIAAATTVVFSTSLGIPVSATQTLVGAILGVGLARGIDALNLRVVRNIFMSWIITIPVSASLSIAAYYALHATFGVK